MIIDRMMSDSLQQTTPFFQQLRAARRSQGISQSVLAAETGCTQSAVSMMEKGRMDALGRDKLVRIAERLGVALPKDAGPAAADGPVSGFCPECDCPSNEPYLVGPHVFFRPIIRPASAAHGHHCPDCGEVLETACPHCGRTIQEGACCRHCGTPYVIAPPETVAAIRRRKFVRDAG